MRRHGPFLREMFEVGRRNKILNPSKMRDTYGKLMHLLQDGLTATTSRSLGISLHKEIIMVGPFLEEKGAAGLLKDERIISATQCVRDRDATTGEKRARELVRADVFKKNALKEKLIKEYASCVPMDHDCETRDELPL